MLAELVATLAAVPAAAAKADYFSAIVEHNVLGKPTAATRRLTGQRLAELYALDPQVPLFRILRRLWDVDGGSRPLLALLVALARDPLLAATASAVISLHPGEELSRSAVRAALRETAGERLSDATLDKVGRNAASSWAQTGHLQGRTFKHRQRVSATPATIALALFMAQTAGFRGHELLTSGWTDVLDCTPGAVRALAIDAKRVGLIDLRMAGDVFEVDVAGLDPLRRRT